METCDTADWKSALPSGSKTSRILNLLVTFLDCSLVSITRWQRYLLARERLDASGGWCAFEQIEGDGCAFLAADGLNDFRHTQAFNGHAIDSYDHGAGLYLCPARG